MSGQTAPLILSQRDTEFVIRIGPHILMGSRSHGTEEILAELASARIAVAGLVPALIEWNRGPLAHLAGRPLEDLRVPSMTRTWPT